MPERDDDLSTWTTEALRDYEEQLYDQEVAGEDVWFLRDQVLRELNSRDDYPTAVVVSETSQG